jgi:hypothetical protein
MFVKQDSVGRDMAVDHTLLMGVINGCGEGCKEMHLVKSGRNFSLVRCITNGVSER